MYMYMYILVVRVHTVHVITSMSIVALDSRKFKPCRKPSHVRQHYFIKKTKSSSVFMCEFYFFKIDLKWVHVSTCICMRLLCLYKIQSTYSSTVRINCIFYNPHVDRYLLSSSFKSHAMDDNSKPTRRLFRASN